MEYVDTHCHIHDSEFIAKSDSTPDEILKNAVDSGVVKLICVGTSIESSREARDFAGINSNCYFSVAIHPHEAAELSEAEIDASIAEIEDIIKKSPTRLIAIGECGLDYYYHSDDKVRIKQKYLFEKHIELANKYELPMIFHIRNAKIQPITDKNSAFDDFFSLIDKYGDIRGVVHSFSATTKELDKIVARGLFIGLNGIMTFTTDEKQLKAAREAPIDNILIETDSPFLTPNPLRGTINQPKHVILITQFLSELRGESQALLAKQTTKNAKQLFKL